MCFRNTLQPLKKHNFKLGLLLASYLSRWLLCISSPPLTFFLFFLPQILLCFLLQLPLLLVITTGSICLLFTALPFCFFFKFTHSTISTCLICSIIDPKIIYSLHSICGVCDPSLLFSHFYSSTCACVCANAPIAEKESDPFPMFFFGSRFPI